MSDLITAYQCDAQGVFVGMTQVQEDPTEPGALLLPPGCVLIAPPAFDARTQRAVYQDDAWSLLDVPEPKPVMSPVASNEIPTPANRPKTGEHEIAVIVEGRWTVVPDWRGVRYWSADGGEHVITDLGDTVPPNASLSPPSPPPAPAS